VNAGPPPALLLIDIQQGLDEPSWGERNNPGFERNIAELLAGWRQAGWPVVHVQHMSQNPRSPLRPHLPGNAFKPEAMPHDGEPVFQKTVNSAFIGTELERHLRREGIHSLVITGLTTDHCVSSSARMAANLGFDVVVVSDATATHERTGPDGVRYSADEMHRTALASLHGEFARVQSARDVLQERGMATLHRIAPCLWFDDQAEEAARFYTSIFKNSTVRKISRYGEAGREFHRKEPGTVMTVEFELEGQPFTALNGGPTFKFTEAISLQIYCRDQAEVDYYWDRLTPGGDDRAQACGWLKDRFGVSWQVVPTTLVEMISDPASASSQRAMNALLRMKKIDIAEVERAYAG
jgi:predicted 3-demethylubiquinone-9 3-methyltransferase (glyoxalase superfamily)/nicotinamidase-related amidase